MTSEAYATQGRDSRRRRKELERLMIFVQRHYGAQVATHLAKGLAEPPALRTEGVGRKP